MVAQGTRPPPLAPSTWITPAVAISLPMSGVAPVLCAAADIEVMASTQADISAGGFNIFCVYLCLFIIFTPPATRACNLRSNSPLLHGKLYRHIFRLAWQFRGLPVFQPFN